MVIQKFFPTLTSNAVLGLLLAGMIFSSSAQADPLITDLPPLLKKTETKAVEEAVKKALLKSFGVTSEAKLDPKDKPLYEKTMEKLLTYVNFVGASASDEGTKKYFQEKIINRLLDSSLQFLFCEDPQDWACLEQKPEFTPVSESRRDLKDGLGTPKSAGASLTLKTFFTKRFNEHEIEALENVERTMAKTLASTIKKNAQSGLSMALYGIDDVGEEGSMKVVLDSILERIDSAVDVRGVFDVEMVREYDVKTKKAEVTRTTGSGKNKVTKTFDTQVPLMTPIQNSIVFSYLESNKETWLWGRPKWMDFLVAYEGPGSEILPFNLGVNKGDTDDMKRLIDFKRMGPELADVASSALRIDFQYNPSKEIIKALNAGISSEDEARARIEWPINGPVIMHNKFFVMKSKTGTKKVWTGTTNVSRTCMGDELNANMSLFIENDKIAQSFQDEFDEMYNFDDTLTEEQLKNTPDKKTGEYTYVNSEGKPNLPAGRFQNNKRPNSHRYFTFKDGTEVRVHFSPTDDGEHRVVIPMLHSARKGDIVRIAMFGGTGLELTRAIQIAVARGAHVKMVLDSGTFGIGSWTKGTGRGFISDSILATNPIIGKEGYPRDEAGTLIVRTERWDFAGDGGLVHHKTGSLTRALSNGKYQEETIVVGSQNWSEGGNDNNDENMVSIRNLKKGLPVIQAFNKHFDEELLPAANILPKLMKDGTVEYEELPYEKFIAKE